MKEVFKKIGKIILVVFASIVFLILYVGVVILLGEKSYSKSPNSQSSIKVDTIVQVPQGFNYFSGKKFKANYRIFATLPDSLHHFKIQALMTAYINYDDSFSPTTIYVLQHTSGKAIEIETHDELMTKEEFRKFIHSTDAGYKDTILQLENTFDLVVKEDEFYFAYFQPHFAFMDVSFKGYPSLVVKKEQWHRSLCYFDVYGFNDKDVHKVNIKPYSLFANSFAEDYSGYGTIIDYKKKEIIIPELGPQSCACHGTIKEHHYAYNPKTEKFDYSLTHLHYGDE